MQYNITKFYAVFLFSVLDPRRGDEYERKP